MKKPKNRVVMQVSGTLTYPRTTYSDSSNAQDMVDPSIHVITMLNICLSVKSIKL